MPAPTTRLSSNSPTRETETRFTPKLGWAWLAMCGALALHVTDEALTGFLAIYNPTVLALRARIRWFPMPAFGFREWLFGLIAAICFGLLLTPLFFRGHRVIRPFAWFVAVVAGLGNATGHITGTILGRTVASVRFPRPMPGFWSSPLLIAAAIWLIVELRRTR